MLKWPKVLRFPGPMGPGGRETVISLQPLLSEPLGHDSQQVRSWARSGIFNNDPNTKPWKCWLAVTWKEDLKGPAGPGGWESVDSGSPLHLDPWVKIRSTVEGNPTTVRRKEIPAAQLGQVLRENYSL